ncbi:hypothetical protein [Endozoicomonas lisbonensis]|uniref:Outer membrane protein n=1 Tax=Endozoicomonas lisbonensis TaxID=3120522 RepID=A0ABV2SJ08_9GAMM
MKKSLLAAAVLLVSASNAQALVGAKVGYNYWNTANHDGVHNLYANFEHFVPLVPNVAVRYTDVDSRRMKFNSFDALGYYRLLDNGNLDWNLGLGLRRFDSGKLKGDSFSSTLPMISTEVTLFDASRTSFYGKMDWGKNGNTDFTDFEAGVRFKLFMGLRLQAGYRNYQLNFDGTKGINDSERLRGMNLGLHWGF